MSHVSTLTPASVAEPEPESCTQERAQLSTAAAMGSALGLFAAARLLGVAALAPVAWATGRNPLALLGRSWDSLWYLGIVVHGYGRNLSFRPGVAMSDFAFFPLYPALVRAVTAVSPLSGGASGLVVSWTAAAVAACGIYAVGARLHGRAVATALVLLWGCCRTRSC